MDVDELLDYTEMELYKVAEGTIKSDTNPYTTIIKKAISRLRKRGRGRRVKAVCLRASQRSTGLIDGRNSDLLSSRPSIQG